MDEAGVERLADRAQHLTALLNSPSYPVLKQIVEGEIEKNFRRFVGPEKLDEQDLNYGRGYLAGMHWVLKVIEGGERQFVQATKRARMLEELATKG